MSELAQELDSKLQSLDAARARHLEVLVREALKLVVANGPVEPGSGWPPNYFEQTSGVLAGEKFERPAQGQLPAREVW